MQDPLRLLNCGLLFAMFESYRGPLGPWEPSGWTSLWMFEASVAFGWLAALRPITLVMVSGRVIGSVYFWVSAGEKKDKLLYLLVNIVSLPIALSIFLVLFLVGVWGVQTILASLSEGLAPSEQDILYLFSLGLPGLIFAWPTFYFFRDRAALNRAKQNFVGDRPKIASAFLSFRSAAYRLKYARWLDARSTDARICDLLKSPDNRWPEGRRPNVDDDAASILLARLDERWLGLDR